VARLRPGLLRSVDPAAPIYSNVDSAVRLLRPGFSGGLPAKADVRSSRPNPRYRDAERLRGALEGNGGVIVYFTAAPVDDAFLPSLPELVRDLRLTVVAQREGWVVLRPSPLSTSDMSLVP
jgi:hypothetical protein